MQLTKEGKLSTEVTYIVSIRFWKDNLTSDNDFYMALCDSSICAGFLYWDNRVIDAHEFSAVDSGSCHNQKRWSSWTNDNARFWEMRFELTKRYTIGSTWSTRMDNGFTEIYTAKLNPFNGLWIMACRNNYDEEYGIHFIEVSVLEDTYRLD